MDPQHFDVVFWFEALQFCGRFPLIGRFFLFPPDIEQSCMCIGTVCAVIVAAGGTS